MYAVIEFDTRECSVVPLSWLVDDQTKCLWPTHISKQEIFEEYVRTKKAPSTTWKQYAVKKLHQLFDTYNQASDNLTQILEDNSSSEGGNKPSNLIRKEIMNKELSGEALVKRNVIANQSTRQSKKQRLDPSYSDDELSSESEQRDSQMLNCASGNKPPSFIRKETANKEPNGEATGKRNQSTKQPKKQRLNPSYSEDEFSSESEQRNSQMLNFARGNKTPNPIHKETPNKEPNGEATGKRNQSTRHSKKQRCDPSDSDEFSSENEQTGSHIVKQVLETQPQSNRASATSSLASTVTVGSTQSVVSNASNLSEVFLHKLEKIIATQDQQSIILDNVLRHLQSQVVQRPSDFPNLPISNKNEYRVVEDFLHNDEKFSYMVKRLSTIGGSCIRNTTMNMLKYLLTNQVAMKFNWSGKDKRPFKRTKMCAAIIDAVKQSYTSHGNVSHPELTDKVIKESIQDWLKLAKARYNYSVNKDK